MPVAARPAGRRRRVGAALAVLLVAATAAGAAAPPALRFPRGAVVAVEPEAAAAGATILARGGNAADAAVTVALVLAVVHPRAGNLAGGHFTLWRGAGGEVEVIDGREAAPAAASAGMFLDPATSEPVPGASLHTPLAIAVPGTLPALGLLHARHGRLPWRDVVEPARRLAARGFRVSPLLAADLARQAPRLLQDPDTAAAYLPGGVPPQEGDRMRLPDLARTLRAIRDHGPEAIFRPRLAALLSLDLARRKAALALTDLAAYRPRVCRAVATDYRGFRIWTPPLPSAGGLTVARSLRALEPFHLAPADAGGARLIHLQAEVWRRAFAERHLAYGGPQGSPGTLPDPLDPSGPHRWSREIALDRAAPSAPLFTPTDDGLQAGTPVHESPETTHFSIVDADGNAVSHTTTLNGSFGAGLVARGTGILWNNAMDDFSVAPGVPNLYGIPGSAGNAIAPGRRPLSSMTPIIVERDGHLAFVLGSPGGAFIPTVLTQVLVALIDLEAPPAEAVQADRVHHQGLPDRLRHEPGALAPEVRARLVAFRHRLARAKEAMGDVHLLAVAADGSVLAAPDPRRHGGAAGF